MTNDNAAERRAPVQGERGPHGAGNLRYVCERYSLPIPDDPALQRMADGLPCDAECEEGCR